MAQNITWPDGTQFANVPAFVLPKTGGGTARFTDVTPTTATDPDVTSGKIYFKADGSQSTGTGSGGSAVIEALNVTANGTYTPPVGVDGYSPVTVNVSGGGGSEWWDTPEPTDGKTHIWVDIPSGTLASRLKVCVSFKSSTANNTTIDWGDGTTETQGATSSKKYYHTFSAPGQHEITLAVSTGTIDLSGGGNKNIMGNTNVAGESWIASYAVRRVFVGNNVTNYNYICYGMTRLKKVSFAAAPSGTGTYVVAESCAQNVYLPSGLTTIGTYFFNNNRLIQSVTIPKEVTSIGNTAFSGCRGLHEVVFADNSALTTIGSSAFSSCFSLTSITIPSGVTSIAASAFTANYSLAEIHFKPTTPPTVANSNAFNSLPTDCKIYVPSGSLSAYTSATNYPSSSTYTYIEE